MEDRQQYTEPIAVAVACRLKELGTGVELVKKDNLRREIILIRVANAPCSWGVIENVAGMGTPKESTQRNRDYIRSIGL